MACSSLRGPTLVCLKADVRYHVMDKGSYTTSMNDNSRRKPDLAGLFQIAVGQQGYFTAAQARECGVSKDLVKYHVGTGRFQRAHRGVYRYRDYPPSPREHVAAAWQAVGKDKAVVSHESALDLHELSDVIPWGTHITVPREQRSAFRPEGVLLHTTMYPPTQREIDRIDGVRVTSPARTIVDLADTGRALEHVFSAVRDGLERGVVTQGELRRLAATRGARVSAVVDQAIGAALR